MDIGHAPITQNEISDTEGCGMIRMVIVDDCIETAETLSNLYALRDDVEVVGIVQSGEQLWRILGQTDVDLVSLDIQLGHENGLELCQLLHKKYPRVFIVMCSVEETIENRRLALEAGATHFLSKPITMNCVSETVQMCLDHGIGANHAEPPLTLENLDDLFDALK